MRKYILAIFIFFILFSLFANSSYASIFDISNRTEIIGIDCGVPDSTKRSKCCRPDTIKFEDYKKSIIDAVPRALCIAIIDTSSYMSAYIPDFIPDIEVKVCATDYIRKWLESEMDKSKELKRIFDLIKKLPPEPCSSGIPEGPGVKKNPDGTPIRKADGSYDIDFSKRCTCVVSSSGQTLCNRYVRFYPDEFKKCQECTKDNMGIWTAVGCIYTNKGEFISKVLLGWGIGLAGLITFFCIIYSAVTIQISRANPEKIKKAQEMLTSCIIGLLVIIFSVLILKVIGVDIIKIPGLG